MRRKAVALLKKSCNVKPCLSSAGAKCRPTMAYSVKSPSPPCRELSKFLLTPLRDGVRVIWSAVCLSPAAVSKNATRKTKTFTSVACRIWSTSIKVCVCRLTCRASTWTWRTCVWNRPFACSTSASPPTPCRAGRWLSRSAIWRTTAKSTPLPVTASGRVRVPTNSRPR